VLTIPDHAQGAAIGGGGLWIARSDWSWGTLDRLDPETGTPQRRYEIAPGTEGIAFGSDGRLWAVSEAGSRHISDHPFLGLFEPFFPLVFALDLSRLELSSSGSHATLRWREMDSNYRPPVRTAFPAEIVRRCVRLVLTPRWRELDSNPRSPGRPPPSIGLPSG
jgi:hypothetical protein